MRSAAHLVRISGWPHLFSGSRRNQPLYRVIPTKAREENLSSLFTPSWFPDSGPKSLAGCGVRARAATPKGGLALTPCPAGIKWPRQETNARDAGRPLICRASASLRLRLQLSALGHNSSLEESPEIDQQFPRHRDNADLAGAFAVGEPPLEPKCQLALGLEANPGPGQLNRQAPHVAVAVFADPLLVQGISR